jgi:outer membrane protein assembly factor BamD (BamD/ComL family)
MVIEKYPFSRYAILAEFGHAQALAVQGESEGALVGFSRFLKQHPGHPRSVDVRHAVVITHWSERPSDFILLPPPYERDLDDVRAAVAAADQFLRSHGEDGRAKKVRAIKDQARKLLYQQAVFLARWTDEQGRPHAALQRWNLARREFSDQSADGKDVQWAKGLKQRVAARPIKVPEPPSLHPPAPVVGRGTKP